MLHVFACQPPAPRATGFVVLTHLQALVRVTRIPCLIEMVA